MTVLLRRFHASVLYLLCAFALLSGVHLSAQTPTNAPDRIIAPVRTDLPGRTVWAFATTGTGTNITTFAATDKGLYKSSGGAWSLTSLDKQSVYAVKSRDIGRTSTLLVGTDKGVLRSVDGGNTWTSPEVTTGTVSTSNIVALKKVFDIEVVQPGNGQGNGNAGVWFAATEKGVYRSTNDGRSWSLVNIDRTADNNEVRGITTDGNTIIVNLWKEGLWRSTNNGNSWTKITIPGESALCRAVYVHQGKNGTVWFAGSVSGSIWRSLDNGTSWTRAYQTSSTSRTLSPSALTQAGIDAFASWRRTDERGILYTYCFAATPSGIAYSANDGAEWFVARTSQAKAVALTAWDNRLYVGSESVVTSGLSLKSGAATQGATDASNEYTILCAERYVTNRVDCAPASSGSPGGYSNGSTIYPQPYLNRNGIRPNHFDQPAFIGGQQWALQGQELHHAPTVLIGQDTSFSDGNVIAWIPQATITPTQISGTPSVSPPSEGIYYVQVRTNGGASNREPFAVGNAVFIRNVQISPAAARSGDPVTVVISGIGIRSVTKLLLNGQEPQPRTYSAQTDSTLTVTFTAPPTNTYTLALQNYTYTSNGVQWTVLPAAPQLSTITPTSAFAGQNVSFRAVGTGLSGSAELLLNDALVSGIQYGLRNGTELNATFIAPVAGSYTAKIRVVEQSTTTLPFTVTNPQVTITTESTTPPQAVVNQNVQVAYGGSGFLAGITSVSVSGPGGAVTVTPTVAANSISFQFTPTIGGTYTVTIQNPGTGAVVKNFTVLTPPPTPTVTTLTQNGSAFPSVVAASADQTLTLNGANFQANTEIRLTAAGVTSTITPTAWTASSLTFTIPAAKLATPQQTLSIAAYTPPLSGYGGGLSTNAVNLHVVLPPPTITGLTPASALAGTSSQDVTFGGEGIVPGLTTLEWTSGGVVLGANVQSAGGNLWKATLTAAMLQYPTAASIRLVNPAWQTFGGGSSTPPAQFIVNNLTPRLDSVTPHSYAWGGGEQNFPLTIIGANFNPSTKLVLNGVTRAPLPQNISPTSIAYTVTFSDVGFTAPGALSVRVLNPSPGSGNTDLYSVKTDTFRVVNPAPVIYTLAQQAVITQLPTSIVLSGASFLPGVTADIAGVAADVTRTNDNTITIGLNAAVQARLLALGTGVHYLTVRNLPPAAAETRLPLTVVNPGIITLTVTPNPHQLTAPPSAQTVTLTALSSGAPPYIATNASVTFRGQTFPFASRPSQSQITVTIPASLLDAAGSYPITVNQPAVASVSGSGSSQSAAWQLNNPRPVVTSMTSNPTSALAGTDVVLTLDGSAFVPAAAVVWRGNTYTPSSNTGNRITVTIPASALDSAGSFPVIVRNPSGGGDAVNQPLLTVLAPRPLLNPLAQQSVTLSLTNPQPLTLNLTGSGFVRGSRFIWNVLGAQSSITTTYTNSNNLSATIPANLLTQAGVYRLAVVNDALNGLGGGTSDTLTFTVNNPQAGLTQVNPQLLPRFANSADLTLTGSAFVTGARLLVTGLNNVTDTLTAQVQSATQITATLPASLLDSAATLTLRILNPAPTVGVSNQVNANVVNPRPRLTALLPTSTLTGTPSLTLTASGSQFMDGAVGYANGVAVQTVVNNTGSLTLTVPASALAVAGTVLITVQNPQPRVQPDVSDTLQLRVDNPLPVLDSVTTAITVSTAATTIQLFGANFILASQVKENGGGRAEATLTSNRLSLTQMTATIPPALTTVAGTLTVLVENPTPGGGRSQSVNVAVVHPVPTVQRITPSVVTMSANDVTVVITGDRFVSTSGKASEVLINGQAVTVTQNTPTRLTATIPAALITARGAYTVVVRNPQTNGTDGGSSSALTFTVNTPQPLVTSIDLNGSPNQVSLDTVNVPLTVNGSRFLDSAVVRIIPPTGGAGTIIVPQNITGSVITALIPASVLPQGGVYQVIIDNPAPTDAPSAPVTFAVVNPVPQMDSISTNGASPRVVIGSTTPQTITVVGQKFTPTSVVKWRGQNLTTTFVNRSTLTAILPASLQTRGALGAVTVFTPTDGVVLNGNPVGGGTGSAPSSAGVLIVTHAVPLLGSATPQSLPRDAWAASALPSLTLNGTLFASTASVRIQSNAPMATVDTTLTPTSVNANGLSLVVTLPRSVVVTAGTFTLTVTNPPAFATNPGAPDGGTSSLINLMVTNPTPALGSLAPASLPAASAATPLTITGSNFTRETQLFVNGAPAPRTVVSASQITTTLPASLFTLSGYVNVHVLNPAPSVSGSLSGDSSNTLGVEVYNPVPALTTVAPVFAPIGGRAAADSVTITLVGTNFVRNSVARIATTVAGAPTTDLPTTFVATTTLTVRLLPADWKAQAYNMTVFNPLPRGGVSAVARRFTVTNPLPILTALVPNSTTASGKAWTLRTVGNFFTATSQISYNKALQSLANTTYRPNALTPSNQDTLLVKLAAVPVGDTTFPVVVYNPPTGGVGGGTSDTLRLAVGLPAPTITSLSPATTTATFGDKNRAWTLTVNGTLFDDQAKVFVNGAPVYTEFVSTTRLRAVLPDSMQVQQARRTVQVRNTPVLVSNLTTSTVQNPAPVLSAITPSTITAGRDTTLVLTGDRFAPDATVRVVFAGVTTVLTPSRRDSVNSLTVPLPANLITAQGNYSVQVINKGLQPTMVPPDTTVLGGGTDALALTVQHDALAIVEYIGVDTLVNAGGNMPAFTVRFRDRVLNLVDNDGAVIYYRNPAGSVASYWTLTRTSLGTYRTAVTPFTLADSYRLWLDTASYGALAVTGANTFRVQPLADSIATFTGLESRSYVAAGDTLPSFTASIVDKLGNPTDNSSLRFSYARSVSVGVIAAAPASGATVRAARLQTGLYRIESTVATIAGVYTYTLAGIPTHVGQRTVEVMPRTPASVDFVNVKEIVVAGQKQTAVQVTYRDCYGNLTDSLSPTQNRLWYSNSTDATVSSTETLTLSETLTQRVNSKTGVPYRGIYDASVSVVFPFAAKYSLAVDGITTTTGTTAFEVVPNVDFRIVFENVPDTITAGDSLRNVVVHYFDASGNPTDNGIGRVLYTKALPAGGSSTATIAMTRTGEGVYALTTTQATLSGTYTMSVSGIATVNYQGNRVFVLRPQIPISAAVTISTGAMTSKGASVAMTVTFRDVYGNGTDAPSVALLANQQIITSQATFSLRKTGTVGTFVTTAVVTQPGEYLVVLSATRPAEQGGGSVNVGTGTTTPHFNINPGLGLKATFFNVPSVSGVGDVLLTGAPNGIAVRLTDTLGAYTNVWDGTGRLTGTLGGVTFRAYFNQRDPQPETHSGWFDLASTTATLPVAGRYTFTLFHQTEEENPPRIVETPFRSYTGNRVVDAVAKPVLNTVTPTTTLASVAAWTLRVDGTGFTANSKIMLNGMTQATTRYVSPTAMTLEMSNSTYGTLNVQVISNTTKGVLSAAALPVTVYGAVRANDVRITVDNLPASIQAGAALAPFTMRFSTLTNVPAVFEGTVLFSRGKGVEPMPATATPLEVGFYQATPAAPGHFFESGEYNLLVQLKGTSEVVPTGRSITVQPAGQNYVEVQDFGGEIYAGQVYRIAAPSVSVMENFAVGDILPSFTLKSFDRFGNPADFAGTVTLTNLASGTVQTFPTTQEATGVYRVQPTMLTTQGAARLSFGGLPLGTGTEALAIPLPIDIDGEPPTRTPSGEQPQLLCVNPRVITGVRSPIRRTTIDPATPDDARNKHLGRGYKLVWSDEFNGTTLDETKWTIETGHPQGLPTQYVCRRNNVVLSGGQVNLHARKEGRVVTETNNFGVPYFGTSTSSSDISSASIYTKYKGDWRFAIVEVGTTHLPTANGMWPAIWMYHTDRIYGIGELDVLEMPINNFAVGADRSISHAHATTHWGTNYNKTITLPNGNTEEVSTGHHQKASIARHSSSFENAPTIFSLDWQRNNIIYGVSSAPFNTQSDQKIGCNSVDASTTLPPAIFNTAAANVCSSYYPFNDARYYLLLGSGMGETDGKNNNPAEPWAANAFKTTWSDETVSFDYVRVYQLERPRIGKNSSPDDALDDEPRLSRDVITLTGTGFAEENSTVVLYPLPSGAPILLETVSRRAKDNEIIAFFTSNEAQVPSGRYQVAVRTPTGESNRREIEIRRSSVAIEPTRSSEAFFNDAAQTNPYGDKNQNYKLETFGGLQANLLPMPTGDFSLVTGHTGVPRLSWYVREQYRCADGSLQWTAERPMQRNGVNALNVSPSLPAQSADAQPYQMPGYIRQADFRLTVQTDDDCTALITSDTYASTQTITHSVRRTAPPTGRIFHYSVSGATCSVDHPCYPLATTASTAIPTFGFRTTQLGAGLTFENLSAVASFEIVWETSATRRTGWQQWGALQTNNSPNGELRTFQMPTDEAWVLMRARPQRITYSANQPGIPAGCTVADMTDAVGEIFYLRNTHPDFAMTAAPIPPPPPPATLLAQKADDGATINAVAGLSSESIMRNSRSKPTFSLAPNPSSDNSICTLSLPEGATVTLEVLDQLQRVIIVPLDAASLERGTKTIVINTASLANGIYTVRLRTSTASGEASISAVQLVVFK